MSAYATLADVKARLSGDVPNMGGNFDATITAIITMVSAELDREVALARGQAYPGYTIVSAGTPVTRRYSAPPLSDLLLIDDAVSVSAVALLDQTGAVVQTLTSGTDYLPKPLNATPITALVMLNGYWPTGYGAISVTLVPGYASTLPDDLHNACIEEAAQVYLSSQAAGFVTAKELSERSALLIESYSYGAGQLRRT